MQSNPNRKLVCIVDDAAPEPLFDALQDLLGVDSVDVWPLSNLIRDAGIRFIEGRVEFSTQLHWPEGTLLSHILDRAVEITRATTKNAAQKTGLIYSSACSIGLVSSALQHILKKYQGWSVENCQYSTVGKVLPLHLQWLCVERALPDIKTPSYLYGYGPEVVNFADFENPICKSPFDLYSWKTVNNLDKSALDKFIVERPKGSPVLSFCIEDLIFVCDPSTGLELTDDRIIQFTRDVARLFCRTTRIAEILWFIDEDRVTFAAFSHKLFSAVRTKIFQNRADEFYNILLEAAFDWSERCHV